MATQSVNHATAKSVLENAWAKIGDKSRPDASVVKSIEAVILGNSVTFRYILVTGLLAKCTNPKVHPRAIQTGSTLPNPYDARSLCHAVVVRFEKPKGNLFGLSNEPFVNKPARHPEHDKDNTQLRNKSGATLVHELLEYAHANPKKANGMLVHCLRVGKKKLDAQVKVVHDTKGTHRRVSRFVDLFLVQSDGGSRLAAVTGAFAKLMNGEFQVKVYHPNFSDKFAKTSGDVEIRTQQKTLISAFECKDRPITVDDIRHGIKKAQDASLSEYWFVGASGISEDQRDDIEKEIDSVSEEIDVYLQDIKEISEQWIATLNPTRRSEFGSTVTEILRKDMKKSDSANEAARLWNSVE